jgi:hypothetical protein
MILLVYPKYVGGKFISNCFALSRHCVVQDFKTASMDIKLGQQGFNEAYYKFKLAAVMKTLPLKQDMAQWGQYEYGCDRLYGMDEDFYKNHRISHIRDFVNSDTSGIFKLLADNARQSCLITHDYRTLMKYLMVWGSDSPVIEFTEYEKFRATAAKLKSGTNDYSITQTKDYKDADSYHHADQTFYQLDSAAILAVDPLFSSWPVFKSSMSRIYTRLGFTDFNADLMQVFYEAYMSLHQ